MSELYRGYANYYRSLNRMDASDFENNAVSYGMIYDRFLPPDRTARILDLGCGGGHFLFYVKSRGFSNHMGVEMDADLAAFVRGAVTPFVSNIDMFDFLASTEEDGWRVVALNDVLEHFSKTDGARLLKLVRRALANDGRILIKTINMSNPLALRSRYMDLTHEQGYTEESIAHLLNVADLTTLYIGPAGSEWSNRLLRLVTLPLYRLYGHSMPNVLTANLLCVATK